MGKTLLLLLLPLLMVAGAVLFLQGKATQIQPTTTKRETPESNTQTIEQASPTKVREIIVSGTEFAFSPSTITIKKGKSVKLIFENKGVQTHDWVIEDLDIKTQRVKGSNQDTLEFQAPDKEGSYNIICSVPGHKEAGMVGKLLVE